MALAPLQPTHHHHDRELEPELDLPGAMTLLASLALHIHAVLVHSPLRVLLGRLAVTQLDPTHALAHVLYIKPYLCSPDGCQLCVVCGAFFFPFLSFFSGCFVSNLPSSLPSPGLSCGNLDTELVYGATPDECSTILSHGLCKLLGLIKQVRIIHPVCYIH